MLADLAISWVNESPELVTKDDQVLMAIAKNFPSDLSFGEALIYPCMSLVYIFHSKKQDL